MYYQDDKLKDLIDWDNIMPMERYAGGHDSQMLGLLKGAKVLSHWTEGDYQGTVATVVELPDGRVAYYNDYYGSCSGCDSWEGASDDSVRKMCIDLANGAYVFASRNDAMTWIASVASGVIEPDRYSIDAKQAEGLMKNWGK